MRCAVTNTDRCETEEQGMGTQTTLGHVVKDPDKLVGELGLHEMGIHQTFKERDRLVWMVWSDLFCKRHLKA